MEKKFCPYCGKPLTENCRCEEYAAEDRAALVEEIEERQHASGMYAFQDLLEMYRNER